MSVIVCCIECSHLSLPLSPSLRYGHASVQLSEDLYLIYGGFGIKGPNLGHGRLDNLIEMKRSITNGKWNIEELKVSGNGPGILIKL